MARACTEHSGACLDFLCGVCLHKQTLVWGRGAGGSPPELHDAGGQPPPDAGLPGRRPLLPAVGDALLPAVRQQLGIAEPALSPTAKWLGSGTLTQELRRLEAARPPHSPLSPTDSLAYRRRLHEEDMWPLPSSTTR